MYLNFLGVVSLSRMCSSDSVYLASLAVNICKKGSTAQTLEALLDAPRECGSMAQAVMLSWTILWQSRFLLNANS
jgi:hypothetical protein